MSGLKLILVLSSAWVATVLFCWWVILPLLRRGPGGDPVLGLIWYANRLFCRLIHRPTVQGQLVVRRTANPGGLIVVSNHTGSVDPFLIQSACRFQICWMMARDQVVPALDWLWPTLRFIPVARDGSDTAPLREAIRQVQSGGVVGVFPEGRIVTPPRQIWPFYAGVGLMVARTRAPVLLTWISGTPDTNQVTESLLTPSRACVEFIDLVDFGGERDSAKITRHLRLRLSEASGWPLNDNPPPPVTALEQLQLREPNPHFSPPSAAAALATMLVRNTGESPVPVASGTMFR